MTDSTDKSQKLRKVLEQCRLRLQEGKKLDDSAVAKQFPDLMPELAAELKKLRLVHNARLMAGRTDASPPVMEEAPTTAHVVPRTLEQPPLPIESPREPVKVRYFGDYELLEELGRGGMGVVYKARQVSLNRLVAVKMLLSGAMAGEEEVKRFYSEAEAAGHLEHPHIVPIYEVGEHQGTHYFSMAYVRGRSLHELLRDGPLPAKKAAEYLAKVTDAIAYAHDQGVLHRDLKPHNILIDENDQPRVTDFGLAKRAGSVSEMTATGQILGTPSYMPPEQALADRERIGPRSDVYSLGATLYACITGCPPFQAEKAAHVIMMVIGQEPVAPRVLIPQLDRDVETIALKAMEKGPERRYESAGALREDLQRYLTGHPIFARPVSAWGRGWRWAKRNPWMAGMGVTSAALLLITAVVLAVANVQTAAALSAAESARADERRQRTAADSARDREAEQRRATERERDRLQRLHYAAEMLAACNLQQQSRRAEVVALLEGFYPQRGENDIRRWEWFWLHAQQQSAPERLPPLPTEAGGDAELFGASARLRNLDILKRTRLTAALYRSNTAYAVAWSPDSRLLALAEMNFAVIVDVANPEKRFLLEVDVTHEKRRHERLLTTAFSSDGILIAAGTDWGSAYVWNMQTRKCERTLSGHNGVIRAAAWHPRENILATAAEDGAIRVWDVAESCVIREFDLSERRVFSTGDARVKLEPPPAPTPTARAMTNGGKQLGFYSTLGGASITTVPVRDGDLSPLVGKNDGRNQGLALAWDPKGRMLVAGCSDGSLRIADFADSSPIRTMHGAAASAFRVDWHGAGNRVLAVHDDQRIRIWDWRASQLTEEFPGRAAAWEPNGGRLGWYDEEIRIVDAETRAEDQSLPSRLHLDANEPGSVTFAFSPDGGRLAVLGPRSRSNNHSQGWRTLPDAAGGPVELWNIAPTLINGHAGSVDCLAFHPKRDVLASGGADRCVRLWTTSPLREKAVFGAYNAPILNTAWSGDGRLATSAAGESLIVWDAETGTRKTEIRHGEPPTDNPQEPLVGHAEAVAWRPGASTLAGSHLMGCVKLWDASGTVAARLDLTGGTFLGLAVCGLDWDPQGNQLVMGGYYPPLSGKRQTGATTLWSWKPADAAAIPLSCDWQTVNDVAFSPRGDQFAVAAGNYKTKTLGDKGGTLHYSSLERTGLNSRERRDNAVVIYRAADGVVLHTMFGHEDKINDLAYSPDGERLASASNDGAVRLWDPIAGADVTALRSHSAAVSVAWSKDGTILAAGGTDGRIKLWHSRMASTSDADTLK